MTPRVRLAASVVVLAGGGVGLLAGLYLPRPLFAVFLVLIGVAMMTLLHFFPLGRADGSSQKRPEAEEPGGPSAQ